MLIDGEGCEGHVGHAGLAVLAEGCGDDGAGDAVGVGVVWESQFVLFWYMAGLWWFRDAGGVRGLLDAARSIESVPAYIGSGGGRSVELAHWGMAHPGLQI